MAASATVIPLRWGATQDEWDGLCTHHGLTEDLLPVVSNPKAKVADYSKLQAVGKVPSRYNVDRDVVGIAKWTEKRATRAEVTRWSGEPDYGICVQTRRLRAIDVDVSDSELARRIFRLIRETIGHPQEQFGPPHRYRSNSSKFLLPVWVEGELPKRILRLGEDRGIIEFLGNGQQFVAAGTHPSGARYQWSTGDQPENFLRLEPEELEALWLRLRDAFGAEDERTEVTKTRAEAISDAAARDTVATWLHEEGLVLDVGRDGQLFVPCPNASEHTSDSGPSQTAYYPANTGGFAQGHWVCLHAHCRNKPDSFFTQLLDMVEYPDLSLEVEEEGEHAPVTERTERFTPRPLADFLARVDTEAWLVKHVLPASGLVTVFGESGAGKSFTVIDLACHVALGRQWQGRRVTQARVVYLAAEGQGGIGRRFRAWCLRHDVDPATVPLDVIAARPNFLQRDDVQAVARAIGRAGVVIIDTAMAVTPGGDENSAEDMGKLMAFAALVAASVGGVVILVHHAGKDVSKGQRGWSGLKGAVDTELEVSRDGDARCLRLSKVRDGPLEGMRWWFGLDEVVLGYDAEGDAVTSAVPVYTEPPAAASRGRKLTDLQQLVVEVATDLVALGTDATESDLVAGVVARIPTPDGRDTRRQIVKKAVVRLARLGAITFANDVVGLP
jgi:hypothetical protein